jgi:hypothetical protein
MKCPQSIRKVKNLGRTYKFTSHCSLTWDTPNLKSTINGQIPTSYTKIWRLERCHQSSWRPFGKKNNFWKPVTTIVSPTKLWPLTLLEISIGKLIPNFVITRKIDHGNLKTFRRGIFRLTQAENSSFFEQSKPSKWVKNSPPRKPRIVELAQKNQR